MKINSINNFNCNNQYVKKNLPNFEGKFYIMSDTHTRAPMTAGVLSEIENRVQKERKPAFFIDGGDFIGNTYPVDVVLEMYGEFKKRNNDVRCIFNFGNCEFYEFKSDKEYCKNVLKKMRESGLEAVSAVAGIIFSKFGIEAQDIKPFVIVQDEVEGNAQNILVSGIGTLDSSKSESNLDMQKQALRDVIKPAVEKHKPDKIILMMHDDSNRVEKLLDYAKNDLGIENIELVVGGHPHKIDDITHADARVLYPPVQGKGAYVVENTKNGFEFEKIHINERDKYDYDPLLKCGDDVIKNIDINHPLPVSPYYSKILNSPACAEYTELVANSKLKLLYRDDYPVSENSQTTSLGTFTANAMRQQTKTDIALLLSMHYRERLPGPGNKIIRYNIFDAINVDKNVYTAQDISVAKLKDIFETSLKMQKLGKANSDFFEYSSNIKLVRRVGAKENEDKVAQIYYKENDEWQPLLDENSRPIDPEKKFSISTCEYAATIGRPSLKCFEGLGFNKFENLTTRQVAANALKEAENSPCPAGSDYECSILENI